MTASIIYTGDLRCAATHLQSGTIIQTDAPTDNKGKGEKFSPTDLLCVSLGTCMVTTMGIKAADMNIALDGTKCDITKHMLTDPRRIGKVEIVIHFPYLEIEEKDRKILQKIGDSCPVIKTLHPDLEVAVDYIWAEK